MEYFEAIPVIEAQSNIIDMNINDYSNGMTKQGRKNFFRLMKRTASPRCLQKTVDFEDFIKGMKGG